MSENFLKLNENKTEFKDIGLYQSNINEIHLQNEVIKHVLKAKEKQILEKQIFYFLIFYSNTK